MSITYTQLDTLTTTAMPVDATLPTPRSGCLWLDLDRPTDGELAWLERTFHFHPLTIEDLAHFNQRAKVDAFDGYLFLSLTTSKRSDGDIEPQELEVFLGPDYVITVHREPLPALDKVRAQLSGTTDARLHPDMLLWMIADHMVDAYFPLIDEMEDEIDALEDEILETASQAALQRIYALKRQLVTIRKMTAPMRDVMNSLAGTRYPGIDPRTALYFRDAYDHLTRIYDLIETSRDLLGNLLDVYLSTVSNRLSEIMKRLTLLTTVFMPISFLVGFGGMNFRQLPFDSPVAFGILMTLIVAMPVTMLIWFWRSRWV
jgi:magnesium transporter